MAGVSPEKFCFYKLETLISYRTLKLIAGCIKQEDDTQPVFLKPISSLGLNAIEHA